MPTTVRKSLARNPISPSQPDATGLSPVEAYQHFLPEAMRLSETEVQVCRADLALCLHNVQLGVDSVLPFEARLHKELPALPFADLRSLPDLAAGLIYAANRMSGPASKLEVSDKLARLRRLREPMLVIAEGLAMRGLIPGERVTAIRAGKGAIDAARDGIALDALYREFAPQIAGKHPFTEEDCKEIASLGNYLVRAIIPEGGRQRPEVQSQATQERDRFYTLLAKRHTELRKAGFYLFGNAVDDRVPLLSSRVFRAKKSPAAGAGSDPPPTGAQNG